MRSRGRRGPRALTGALAALALFATACGDDDGGASEANEIDATTAAPVTDGQTAVTAPTAAAETAAQAVDPASSDVPAADAPQRVVSLSPTHTEIMFAIGAGDLLVAVDEFSDHPAEALELPHDLSGFEPNVEAVAAYEPDLVLTGGDFTGLGDQLSALGIEAWDGPAGSTIDATYEQITELGEVTGHTEEATAVVDSMKGELDALVAETPQPAEPLYVYHELDPSLFSVDSTTFIGQVYSMFGLRNIADIAEGDSGGYPQLNAEFIVSADPDIVFLADTKCCGESLETVAARPGWDAITAVQQGAVVEMDDDIASRWGPRIVDYAAAVAAAISSVMAPA